MKDRELLARKLCEISRSVIPGQLDTWELVAEYILNNYELKHKKLPVKIKRLSCVTILYGIRDNDYCPDCDTYLRTFNTHQAAIDFCMEYGLEIIEGREDE